MKRLVCGFIALTCSVAMAENLIYSPASTSTATNKFGRFIYSSENWKTEAGVYKYPANGDVLIYRSGGQLTAQGGTASNLSGIIYDGAATAASQGEFHLQVGGVGMVLTNVSASISWYLGVGLHGSGEFPVYVHPGGTWQFQRYFWQRDNGTSTLVKRGTGTLQFYDSSGWAGSERGNWKETRLEAGIFLWCIYGTKGSNYNYPQLFPTNHVFTFADQGGGATFSISDANLDMVNPTIREASPLNQPNHSITSYGDSAKYLRLTGKPGLNPMGFGGKLENTAGIIWDPDSADCEFVFSNAVSTTTGGLIVSNGTMRLTCGATFQNLSKLTLCAGTKFLVDKGAGSGFMATDLELVDDKAEITIGFNVLSFTRVTRNGVAIPDGVYTSDNCDWVKGNGLVLVNVPLPVQDAWWTNDSDHPKDLAANVQTNWYGLHLSGADFSLTAGSGVSVSLGAGSVVADDNGGVYTIAWPLFLGDTQLWKVGTNATVSLATDDVTLVGGMGWFVNNADSGVLRFDGAKSFPNDITVSNGWIEARGDESLGGDSGTTTFELYNSSGRKGKLRILPEPDKSEVSFHRNITFHYQKCGEWGDFMTLPANCTVNFYGNMSTSCKNCEGNSWPCHWNYTCPATTVVHWWGTMHASLNHRFPGGTHYVHVPLSGGDRFGVSENATVNLLASGNRIGAALGDVQGRVNCCAPYALDGRSDNQLLSLSQYGVLDLGGYDQALSILNRSYAPGGLVTSSTPALLHITLSQVVDNSYNASCTNYNRWVEAAGLSVDRTSASVPMVLMAESSSTGTLQVTSGRLVLHAPGGKWPNAGEAVVKGGEMVLEHSAAIGKQTVVRFVKKSNGAYGKINIFEKARPRIAALEIDGVAQHPGTYGSSESAAMNKNDALFTGPGLLRVGAYGSTVILK